MYTPPRRRAPRLTRRRLHFYIPDAQTRHNAAAPGGPKPPPSPSPSTTDTAAQRSYNVEVPVVSDNANPTHSSRTVRVNHQHRHHHRPSRRHHHRCSHRPRTADTLTYGTTTPGRLHQPRRYLHLDPDARPATTQPYPARPRPPPSRYRSTTVTAAQTTTVSSPHLVPQNGNPAVVPGQAPTNRLRRQLATGQVVGSILHSC